MSNHYYFIDATCDTNARNATQGNNSFDFFVQAAQRWARRAVERLRDNDDVDFARVFNVIFKARKNDRTPLPRPHRWQSRLGYQNDRDRATTFEHVVNVLSDFGNNWRRTDNREEAHVWFVGNVAALDYGQAVGSNGILGSEQFPHFHPNTRIDISNNAWNELGDWDQVLGSRAASFNGVSINDIISGSMARLILYEVMHCVPYCLDDVVLHLPNGSSETSSWEAVMNCKKGDAHRNAESIALLGLWAALADTMPQGRNSGGFTLDRGWDVIPGAWEDVKNDYNDDGLDEEEWGGVSTWTEKWTLHLPYAGNRINRAVRGDIRGYLDLTGTRR